MHGTSSDLLADCEALPTLEAVAAAGDQGLERQNCETRP